VAEIEGDLKKLHEVLKGEGRGRCLKIWWEIESLETTETSGEKQASSMR
jgi:hypothetical protein